MIRRLKKQRGFTLVELMIVVAIIGILAALAVYGVKRYITNSKTAEAKEMLGRIAKDASGAYQRETMAGSVLDPGASSDATHKLCKSSSGQVPTTTPANKKVQSAPADWDGSSDTGWVCLHFSINDPTYYSYKYTSADTAAGFDALAIGDLDGDGAEATFKLSGAVGGGEVRIAPTVIEPDGVE